MIERNLTPYYHTPIGQRFFFNSKLIFVWHCAIISIEFQIIEWSNTCYMICYMISLIIICSLILYVGKLPFCPVTGRVNGENKQCKNNHLYSIWIHSWFDIDLLWNHNVVGKIPWAYTYPIWKGAQVPLGVDFCFSFKFQISLAFRCVIHVRASTLLRIVRSCILLRVPLFWLDPNKVKFLSHCERDSTS